MLDQDGVDGPFQVIADHEARAVAVGEDDEPVLFRRGPQFASDGLPNFFLLVVQIRNDFRIQLLYEIGI